MAELLRRHWSSHPAILVRYIFEEIEGSRKVVYVNLIRGDSNKINMKVNFNLISFEFDWFK